MLASSKIVGIVPTLDSKRAREFYEGKLGFEFISDDPFALVVGAGDTKIPVRSGSETRHLDSPRRRQSRLVQRSRRQRALGRPARLEHLGEGFEFVTAIPSPGWGSGWASSPLHLNL